MIKLPKVQIKEVVLKAARENAQVTFKADLLQQQQIPHQKSMARRALDDGFKITANQDAYTQQCDP